MQQGVATKDPREDPEYVWTSTVLFLPLIHVLRMKGQIEQSSWTHEILQVCKQILWKKLSKVQELFK